MTEAIIPFEIASFTDVRYSEIGDYLKKTGKVDENEEIKELDLKIQMDEPVRVTNIVTEGQ